MPRTINALDPSQSSVLDKLTSNDVPDLSLVYGPPGTGKSHLIVSLLFELARQEKKVLFVSQNREALDVVIRKYHEIDKSLGLSAGDFRFLDLCLCLSDPAQRTLKYIRGQSARIMKGLVQIPYSATDNKDEDEPPYPIKYRDFGEKSISEGSEIGLDELLTAELEFVHSDKIAPAVINRISEINVREVFDLLRNYKQQAVDFKRYNRPNDELRFFNKNNSSLMLGEIKSLANMIIQEFEQNPASFEVAAQKDEDIDELIRTIIVWCQGNKLFNIRNICSDGVDINSIGDKILEAVKLDGRIPESNILGIPSKYKEAILSEACDARFYNAEDVAALKATHASAVKALKKVEELNDSVGDSYTVGEIITAIIQKLGFGFDDSYDIYKGYDSAKMRELSQYANYWNSLGSMKQAFTAIPEIFNTIDRAFIKKEISRNAEYFATIADIIDGTAITYGDLKKICKKVDKRDEVAISMRYGEDRLIKMLNTAFIARELIEDAMSDSISAEDLSIETAKETLKRQIAESNYVLTVCDEKKLSAREAIKEINNGIKKRGLLEQISQIEHDCNNYVRKEKGESFIDYCKRCKDDGQIDKKTLSRCLGGFSADIDIDNIDEQRMIAAEKAVSEAREKDFFSPDFFSMKEGETIKLWLDRVQYIINYQNTVDFNDFVEHNRFISTLTERLGPDNKKLIDKYIEMDLDFDDFAELIVYSLRCTVYNNLPPKAIRTINDGNFFSVYKKELKNDRKNYYLHNIRKMAINCDDPARRLIYYQNWLGTTTMSKIRSNTKLISEAFPIIIATPAEVAKYIAPQKELFDFVIFDEASQLLPGQAIPSIYRAKSAVIVGDPHQMPPISTATIGATSQFGADEDDLDEDQTSILDVVKDMQIPNAYHLKVHYRSKYNVLFEPSRKAIYADDDIRPIVEAQSTSMPLYVEDNLGEDDEVGFSAIVRRANGYIAQNPDTTFCILFTRKDKSGETGFKEYLEKHGVEARDLIRKYENEELLISTVTNCQGIMGDHTILYIPYYTSPKAMWFFKEAAGAYRRLNVSITRQVESLDIIMGNDRGKWMNVCQGLLAGGTTGPNALKSAELLQTLLANAGQEINEDYLERTLGPNKDNIDSPLTKQLYEKLCDYYGSRIGNEMKIWCEVGYKIRVPSKENIASNDYNVGYRIDIGIYSMESKRFVLGIEMDGATYHSGFRKEFSDAQRQEILEGKGWNIYRIWSTNWLHNTQAEFNALVKEIDGLLEKERELLAKSNEEAGNEEQQDPRLIGIDSFVKGFIAYQKTKKTKAEPSKKQDETPSPSREGDEEDEHIEDEPVREPITHIKPHNPYGITGFQKSLASYLKECLKIAKPVAIKYTDRINEDVSKLIDEVPFQKMLIKTVADDYIEARFDANSSYYRINIDKIISYIEE